MRDFEIVNAVMDAVEVHATTSCGESIARFQRILESKDDGFEASWILAERVVAHMKASGQGALVMGVPGGSPVDIQEAAGLMADVVLAASRADRETAAAAWDHAALLVRVTAAIALFHTSIEVGAWSREAHQ